MLTEKGKEMIMKPESFYKLNYKLDTTMLMTAFFLLSIGTLGGLVGGGIISCRLQRFIRNNPWVKNLILFLIIFFTLSVTSKRMAPITSSLLNSLILYGGFVLLHKSELPELLIAIICFMIGYILHKNYDYNLKVMEKDIIKLKRSSNIFFSIGCVVILIGFTRYLIRQRNDHKENFNFFTFLLGNLKCSSN